MILKRDEQKIKLNQTFEKNLIEILEIFYFEKYELKIKLNALDKALWSLVVETDVQNSLLWGVSTTWRLWNIPSMKIHVNMHAFCCICHQVDDYSLVQFLPLDITDEDSINDALLQIDSAIQYGEDFEPKEPKVLHPGCKLDRTFF